jgi:hypothetical protein
MLRNSIPAGLIGSVLFLGTASAAEKGAAQVEYAVTDLGTLGGANAKTHSRRFAWLGT